MKKIVITGGSGMLGTHLTKLLADDGHEVVHLGRTRRNNTTKTFLWNPAQKYIEEGALENTDYIIHLAGEGIAGKRWTPAQKNNILHSRTDGPAVLLEYVKQKNIALKGFFSASGINYYGSFTSNKIYTEQDSPAKEFISEVVTAWEKAAHQFDDVCRVACFRFGLILDQNSGGLPKIAKPVQFGIGSAIGNGKQWMPWIHYEDAAKCFVHAIKNETVKGEYNAVAAEQINNKTFVKTLGNVLHKPVFFPHVPAFLIKLLFGEMGQLVLEGSRASGEKLRQTGFTFRYDSLESALQNIYAGETDKRR